MAQYRTCPYCSAALDPGERCDCPGAIAEQGKEKTADELALRKADFSAEHSRKYSTQRVARKGAACQ